MAEESQGTRANMAMPLLIFPLFLGLLSVTQLVNVTHVDGLADDFTGMILQAVSGNESYGVPYGVVEKHDGAWILVNATLPEGNYTLNVLSSPDSAPPSFSSADPFITEVTSQEGLLPDFSNLIVQYEKPGGEASDIPYVFVGLEPGSWAIIALERAPLGDENIIFSARIDEAAPAENESPDDSPEPDSEASAPQPEPPGENPLADGGDAGAPGENDTAMNGIDGDIGVPEPPVNSTELPPGDYTIIEVNETGGAIGLYADIESLMNESANETQETGLFVASPPQGGKITLDVPKSWAGGIKGVAFTIRGSGGRAFPAEISLSRGGVTRALSLGAMSHEIGLPDGRYDITIRPVNNQSKGFDERPPAPIMQMKLEGVELSEGAGLDLGLEYLSPNALPFGKSARQAFAIDPTKLNFASGEVSVLARGSELYKCAEWDFESRLCNGEWLKQMDLTPGEIYTIIIGPDDPAWAEYNVTYGAPRCANSSSPCYANSSMLQSRDSLLTPEPNQPNTLDACTDGTLGTYLTDESVENITVTSLNSSTFNAGDTVNVTATVYCFDTVIRVAGKRVPPAEITPYTLGKHSEYQEGCWDPCLCLLHIARPVVGGFGLVKLRTTPLFDEYAVVGVDWRIMHPATTPAAPRVHGAGFYLIGGEVALVHRLRLDLAFGADPPARFDSGLIPGGSNFPAIDVAISDNNFYCYNHAFFLHAKPASTAVGDINCDGSVTFADIDPFVLALAGRDVYEPALADCGWLSADCNTYGAVDCADIDAFVALLAGD